MTSKTMLSVERELLEIYTGRKEGDWVEAAHELRALLDKPVVEGEVERLERRCKNAELALKVQTENCEALKAAQHQGEPVAWVIGTEDGSGADYYPGKGLDTLEIGAKLYTEQPAPVSVDVPSRDELIKMLRHFASCASVGQVGTGAMDFVARLNGINPKKLETSENNA